jgi:hypothetical protein
MEIILYLEIARDSLGIVLLCAKSCTSWGVCFAPIFFRGLPSGKLTVCYWKWPFIVYLPINSMVIFNSKLLVYKRVSFNQFQASQDLAIRGVPLRQADFGNSELPKRLRWGLGPQGDRSDRRMALISFRQNMVISCNFLWNFSWSFSWCFIGISMDFMVM